MRSCLLVVVVAVHVLSCGGAKPGASASSAMPPGANMSGGALSPPPPGELAPPPGFRLPRDLQVTGYRPTLVIDPAQAAFTGSIDIDGTLGTAIPTLWLHARNLRIDRARLDRAGAPSQALHLVRTGVDDVIALRGERPLAPGVVTVHLEFAGTLDDTETYGGFRQREGTHWYAFTQFEATGARRVMPCIDEPDRKVPWQLTLDVPDGLVAVANAPEATRSVTPGMVGFTRVQFAPTEPLPSYLLAFAVGPFDVVAAGTSRHGAPLRVITPRGGAAQAAVAAIMMPQVLARIEDWQGTAYPFAKLDALVIPTTVNFGAMENPGLVTYESRVLLMPAAAPATRRRDLAGYMAHEISHMWFGNLVTPTFWDDLWLNESFATWITDRIVARDHPAWVAVDDDAAARDGALHADSLATARRIRQPIETDSDIGAAFDDITYEKGAAVLRMFEHWLGAEVFQRGVQTYLAAHAYGNASADDFLAAMAAATGTDVARPMRTFLDQVGVPQIDATLTCAAGQPASVTLHQQRYLPPGATVLGGRPQTWQVPVCLALGRGSKRAEVCTLLTRETQTVAIPGGACPAWIYANSGAAGYYRSTIAGAGTGWDALLQQGWPQLTLGERLAVVQDMRAQVVAGTLDVQALLEALPALAAGGTEAAMADVVAILDELRPLLPSPLPATVRRWVSSTLGPTARALGWVARRGGDDARADEVRATLLPLVAEMGNEPTLVKAAQALADDVAHIPVTVRAEVLRVAIRQQPERFEGLLALWRASTDSNLRDDLLAALGSVREPAKLEVALALTREAALDIRDTQPVIEAALADDATRPTAEAFVRAHLAELLARMPQDWDIGAAAWLTTSCAVDNVAPMRALADAQLAALPGAGRAIAQAFEGMQQCIAWRASVGPSLTRWARALR